MDMLAQAQMHTQSLQNALNSIFLAIGNAYHEANKLPNKSQVKPLSGDCSSKLKQSQATFLDSLDQIEIMALRATEVLERRARQNKAELVNKNAQDKVVSANGEEGPSKEIITSSGESQSLQTGGHVHGPRDGGPITSTPPNIVMSSGEHEISTEFQNYGNVGTDLQTGEHTALTGTDLDPSSFEIFAADLPAPGLADSTIANGVEGDIMNIEGTVNFADIVFDEFDFGHESAPFDFEAMMDD